MKPERQLWDRCADWAGLDLGPGQMEKLERYRDWLRDEAIPAGGLGPHEADRLDNRHIADSLLFAAGLPSTPEVVLDVGSGAGLPGIPLSILMPRTRFLLLDRSGRRVDLLRRATRILDLTNVEVIQGDITAWSRPVEGIVSRASFSPEQAMILFSRLLKPGGRAVLGGSWSSPPQVDGFELFEVPAAVLDQKVWLLIMPIQ